MKDGSEPGARPLVSVVIPSYNRAQYIAETIESVLAQTYPNIEVIVIDDGSTDDTAKVVERFAHQIRYVIQENSERGASRNHGLRLATGEYIAFLDSDDLWLPRMAEQCVDYLEARPDVGVVYADAMQIDDRGNELRVLRVRGPSGQVTDSLLERTFIFMAAHLVRTSAVREIGGFCEDRQLSGSEDWEMWVRLSLRTRFAYLPNIVGKVRTHPGNTMSDAAAMRRSTACAAELFHRSPRLASAHGKAVRRMDARVALVNAINYCSQKEPKLTVGFLRDALAAHPSIILDPRFGYTVVRLLKTSLGL
jgi:glycosyltransferase involved in cell wall biosynthesis